MHGYDVVDPTRVNPELGGEEGLRRLVGELRRHGLGHHRRHRPEPHGGRRRTIHGGWTCWQRGRDSRYARYFDIDWTRTTRICAARCSLPILGRPYGEALRRRRNHAVTRRQCRHALIRYFDHISDSRPDASLRLRHASYAAFDPASRSGRARLHALLERQHYRLAWWRTANDEINWRRFFDINELAGRPRRG